MSSQTDRHLLILEALLRIASPFQTHPGLAWPATHPIHLLIAQVDTVWKVLTLVGGMLFEVSNNNINKRPLIPKSMPPTGDEHAKLKTRPPTSSEWPIIIVYIYGI